MAGIMPHGTTPASTLKGRIAIVTGGSRGVGKGIALALADVGATVYITGRTAQNMQSVGGRIVAIPCDHRDDSQWRWDAMFQSGVRAHYVASSLAAPMMISRRSGLIVNTSFWSAQKYIGNVAYGVSKAATDKMTADMAHELKDYNVAVVSLYPGLVRTESVLAASAWLDLSNSESPQFVGRAVAALACDPQVMTRSGTVTFTASLAREHGFTDVDGKTPPLLALHEV